jgi:hypothetical protein
VDSVEKTFCPDKQEEEEEDEGEAGKGFIQKGWV